jgi:ribonuclease HI
MNESINAEIFTDGSCHSQLKIGAWAAIIFIGDEKVTLTGTEDNTTHNRMEFLAVLKAIEYVNEKGPVEHIRVFTDSQYVSRIPQRKERILANQFLTQKGTDIRNSDLVDKLINCIDLYNITFIKVKAHQKNDGTINYNREVDKLARKMVRERTKQLNGS